MSKLKISAKAKNSGKNMTKLSPAQKAKAKATSNAREEAQVSMSESFPTLGRQLLTCPIQHNKGSKSESWLRLRPSWHTRFAMMGMAFVQGMFFAFLALAVLYLPDYLFDYGHRNENFLAFFAKFFGIAVFCIALAAGFSTFIRETVVYLDLQRGRVLISRRLNAKTIQERALAFRDISSINLRASEGKFRRSRLFIEFDNREPMLIAESRGRDEDLIALRDWWSRVALRR